MAQGFGIIDITTPIINISLLLGLLLYYTLAFSLGKYPCAQYDNFILSLI